MKYSTDLVAIVACENIRFSVLFTAGTSRARNVPSGEERGETNVFAGYGYCARRNFVIASKYNVNAKESI